MSETTKTTITVTVKSRYDERALYECEAESMLVASQQAVKGGANLGGANLGDANLRAADLRDAYLRGADLRDAYLRGANLGGATINWCSHDLVAEILLRAAGYDIDKRMVAGLILVSRDWGWEKFLAIDRPLKEWAITTLQPWVKEGDHAPEVLTASGRI